MHSGTIIARGRRSTSASQYWKISCLRLTRLSLSESLVLFFVLRVYGAKRNFPTAEESDVGFARMIRNRTFTANESHKWTLYHPGIVQSDFDGAT